MAPARQNQRRFHRVRIPSGVHVRCRGDSFRGVIRVLSEGGMFIDTIHPSPVGAQLDVVIEGAEPICARCISRDHEPGWGMGVEFVSLAQQDRVRIRELVSRYV